MPPSDTTSVSGARGPARVSRPSFPSTRATPNRRATVVHHGSADSASVIVGRCRSQHAPYSRTTASGPYRSTTSPPRPSPSPATSRYASVSGRRNRGRAAAASAIRPEITGRTSFGAGPRPSTRTAMGPSSARPHPMARFVSPWSSTTRPAFAAKPPSRNTQGWPFSTGMAVLRGTLSFSRTTSPGALTGPRADRA